MIYNLMQTVNEDLEVLKCWKDGKDIPNVNPADRQHRIEVAASRMIASVAMAFGGLWAISILTFVATIPLKAAFNLIVAVALYAIARDIFVMAHNSSEPSFKQQVSNAFSGLIRGRDVQEQKRAMEFTHGTFLQPAWMWLYVHRHDIG